MIAKDSPLVYDRRPISMRHEHGAAPALELLGVHLDKKVRPSRGQEARGPLEHLRLLTVDVDLHEIGHEALRGARVPIEREGTFSSSNERSDGRDEVAKVRIEGEVRRHLSQTGRIWLEAHHPPSAEFRENQRVVANLCTHIEGSRAWRT